LRLEGATLYIAPCLHADWPSFTINYRYRETVCYIAVSQISGDDVSARARKRDG
jgi:cellobiose phosphorylase